MGFRLVWSMVVPAPIANTISKISGQVLDCHTRKQPSAMSVTPARISRPPDAIRKQTAGPRERGHSNELGRAKQPRRETCEREFGIDVRSECPQDPRHSESEVGEEHDPEQTRGALLAYRVIYRLTCR